ncbi:MotA/TolQ/ExbB proton channel family protein [Schleiferiaceae bacterium]|nr:MotA/TolQ/ExbB proton channel family protein [Schleiferiaceae bacterium]
MSILSFLLLGVLWTAWKGGPLKELGLLALAIGILGQLIGIYDAFSVFETTEISSALLAGGLKVSLTTTLYGLLIYILSLVLRAAQTWRTA